MANKDKALHFCVGAIIGLIAIVTPNYVPIILSIVTAYSKELIDLRYPSIHTPDHMDALTTIFGTITMVVLLTQ